MNNNLLVEVTKKTYSDLLLEQKYFYDLKIKFYPHNSLNLSKGVVGSSDLSLCTLDEIKPNLCKQGGTDTWRISIKKNRIIQTNAYILSFNTPKRSLEMKIGYSITKFEIYILNLLRCHNCQRFWHRSEKCSRPPGCKKCGESRTN